ncbi:hypothetical protein GGF31_004237 [Allomyces arbusculus]|nr:hypothetical protein GGF31_004237 [Allomyces arbusculus]
MLSIPDYLNTATAAPTPTYGATWTHAREHDRTDVDGRHLWHPARRNQHCVARSQRALLLRATCTRRPPTTLRPYGTGTVGIRTRDPVLPWALHPHVDAEVLCVLVADSARAAADVLSVAAHLAERFGLASLEMYVTNGWTRDMDACVTLLSPGWKRESPHGESLSSLMLWRDKNAVTDSRDEAVWHGNEMYAWI